MWKYKNTLSLIKLSIFSLILVWVPVSLFYSMLLISFIFVLMLKLSQIEQQEPFPGAALSLWCDPIILWTFLYFLTQWYILGSCCTFPASAVESDFLSKVCLFLLVESKPGYQVPSLPFRYGDSQFLSLSGRSCTELYTCIHTHHPHPYNFSVSENHEHILTPPSQSTTAGSYWFHPFYVRSSLLSYWHIWPPFPSCIDVINFLICKNSPIVATIPSSADPSPPH